jgi:hypothetical protein
MVTKAIFFGFLKNIIFILLIQVLSRLRFALLFSGIC